MKKIKLFSLGFFVMAILLLTLLLIFIATIYIFIFFAVIFILISILATIWLAFSLLFDINHRCPSCGSWLTIKYKEWRTFSANPYYFYNLNRFCLKCKKSEVLRLIDKKEISSRQISNI